MCEGQEKGLLNFKQAKKYAIYIIIYIFALLEEVYADNSVAKRRTTLTPRHHLTLPSLDTFSFDCSLWPASQTHLEQPLDRQTQ